MQVVIMAGGKGTRISSIENKLPKPMMSIAGKPILQYQIENLKKNNLINIILVVGYKNEVIRDFFGNGEKFGVNITYFIEDEPMGTAGALFKMPLEDDFLLLCGDIIFDINFEKFIKFHKTKNALATLIVHPNNHPYDSSLIVTEIIKPKKIGAIPEDSNKIIDWIPKCGNKNYYKNKVSSGIEIINPILVNIIKNEYNSLRKTIPNKIDLDNDVLKVAVKTERLFAYSTSEYIKDMGTPERFYQTENDIRSGKVEFRNFRNKQKAIFLDRDGTINKLNGFINSPVQFKLLPNVAKAIKMINDSKFLAIVITNQPVIARGECSFETLNLIHNKMESELGKEGAYLDAIYYCPHHTDKGFKGERIEFKCNCECRKPKIGLFELAAKDFNLDLSQSFMIGDSSIDVEAGNNAGCAKSFLVTKNDDLLTIIQKLLYDKILDREDSNDNN